MHQNLLTVRINFTRFNDLAQIIAESATWAKLAIHKVITGKFIDKALEERIERVKNTTQDMEMIKRKHFINRRTSGFKVGQINGLTIMNVGDYTFGKPVKITANTYTGKSGVVNIEREVALSGSSHSKGVSNIKLIHWRNVCTEYPHL